MKKITGWIGKRDLKQANRSIWDRDIGISSIPSIFPTKGKPHEWLEEDYPPVKVTITIDEVVAL